jgi:hypothetical protein
MAGFVDWLGNKFGVATNPVVVSSVAGPPAGGPPDIVVGADVIVPATAGGIKIADAAGATLYGVRLISFTPTVDTLYLGTSTGVTTANGFPVRPGMTGYDFSKWPVGKEIWGIMSANTLTVRTIQY